MATDQMARLLAMVPWLQRHPGATVTQTAEKFHTTNKQVLLDLQTMMFCGLPGLYPGDMIDVDIEAATEDGEIYVSNADFLERPLRFTAEEALALLVGLESLRDVIPTELEETLAAAVDKLADALGGRPLLSAHDDSPAGSVRRLIARGLHESRCLEIEYAGLSGLSRRLVEPARLFGRDGATYLLAYCHGREAWRTFHLERIVSVVLGDVLAELRTPPTHVQGSWQEVLAFTSEVVLTLKPSAAWVCEQFAPLEVTDSLEGHLRVRFGVVDEEWLTRLLLRLGDDIVRVEPSSAAEAASQRAAAALDLYPRSVAESG